jgi:hypothetical protein
VHPYIVFCRVKNGIVELLASFTSEGICGRVYQGDPMSQTFIASAVGIMNAGTSR